MRSAYLVLVRVPAFGHGQSLTRRVPAYALTKAERCPRDQDILRGQENLRNRRGLNEIDVRRNRHGHPQQ